MSPNISGVSLNNIQTSVFNRLKGKNKKNKRTVTISQFTVDWFESHDSQLCSPGTGDSKAERGWPTAGGLLRLSAPHDREEHCRTQRHSGVWTGASQLRSSETAKAHLARHSGHMKASMLSAFYFISN